MLNVTEKRVKLKKSIRSVNKAAETIMNKIKRSNLIKINIQKFKSENTENPTEFKEDQREKDSNKS